MVAQPREKEVKVDLSSVIRSDRSAGLIEQSKLLQMNVFTTDELQLVNGLGLKRVGVNRLMKQTVWKLVSSENWS